MDSNITKKFIVNIKLEIVVDGTEPTENVWQYINDEVEELISPMTETLHVMEDNIKELGDDIESVIIYASYTNIPE